MGLSSTSIQARSSYQHPKATSEKNSGSDLRNQFMTLLTAQIKNQDPTEPLKPQEQIAQLAQLSQVEQSEKQTAVLRSILDGMSKKITIAPLDLLNRSITTDFNRFSLSGNSQIELKVNSPLISKQGGSIKILVTDQNNRIVKSMNISKDAATHSITWDGKGDLGASLSGGVYSLHAEQSLNGISKKIGITTSGKVEHVDIKNGGLLRLDNGMTISTDSVINVNSK
ncbi:flagellar hook assembly protein FlgD [Photobacterium kishitanii]|nr:flagellar hook capping FlgD N-terminal domain-containing protein [Photobacterium kishitanii]